MRILQIRLKNLNSLVGEWRVDFTHPAYTADGLFAITGPTGAGKSTLLDALCLALYGRTPRLGRISKSSNDIMSRQTGECMAEAVIETASGCYRCHWSQHRARRRAGGELQMPRHEIARAEDGELIESSLRGVAEQVEALTGMDFERFTRSMLLAQGGFAAFLQAAPDERSPLLEQITGTAIYSEISIRVHERYGAARQALEALQAEMAGLTLLSAEDVQALEARRAVLSGEAQAWGEQAARHAEAVRWRESLQRLSQSQEALVARQANWQAQVAAFASDQRRLDEAGRALELAGVHAALQALRQAQQDEQAAWQAGEASLPALATAAVQAGQALAQAEHEASTARAAQRDAQPALHAARALDVRLAEAARPLATLEAEVAALADRLEAMAVERRQLADTVQREGEAQQSVQVWLQTHQADEGLVAALDALRTRFEGLGQRQAEAASLAEAVVRVSAELSQAEKAYQASTEQWTARQRATQACMAERDASEVQAKALLAGATLADVRRRHAGLAAQRDGVREAHDAARAWCEADQAWTALAQRQVAWTAEHDELAGELARQAQQQQSLNRERDLLETQLSLLQRVEDLVSARHQLADGEPCPLCGALSHPYAEGQLPQPDETRRRLTEVRAQLMSVTGLWADLQGRQASVSRARTEASAQQDDWATRRDTAGQRLAGLAVQWSVVLPLVAPDDTRVSRLGALLATLDQEMAGEAARLEAAEAAAQAQAQQQAALDAARQAEGQAEREAQAASHHRDELVRRRDLLRQQADAAARQVQTVLAEVTDAVRPYGVEPPSMGDPASVLAGLAERRRQWLAHQHALTERTQRLAQQQQQAAHLDERHAQAHGEWQARQDALRRQRAEWQAWQQERQALLGDRRVEDEDSRLAGLVEQAELKVVERRRQQAQATQAHASAQARGDGLAQSIAARAKRLAADEPAWRTHLQAAGFASEEAWQAACLPVAQREALQRQATALAREQAAWSAQQRDWQAAWDAEQARALTDATLEAAQAAAEQAMREQQERHRMLGDIEAQLARHHEAQQRQQAQWKALAAQQVACDRWGALHALIGSADGKKYRNFAQGLTFERVIRHANRQLRRMSDRYLLVRDTLQPLSLNVVDAYQAGEVRSTRNLSGGESFIVSLALALGLAQMVSRQVRVDSLFLDEGFGTLDEDALDTALDTLAGLQQDGKVIGVISHVPALKERIATQIQVVPGTGGVSRLSGPGCERVSDVAARQSKP